MEEMEFKVTFCMTLLFSGKTEIRAKEMKRAEVGLKGKYKGDGLRSYHRQKEIGFLTIYKCLGEVSQCQLVGSAGSTLSSNQDSHLDKTDRQRFRDIMERINIKHGLLYIMHPLF
jgi:hypothetical protein